MERPEVDYSRADELNKYMMDDMKSVADAVALWGHVSHRRRTNKRVWEIFETDLAREQRIAEAQEQSRKFKEKITKKRGKR